jgi:hypothetical protein
VTWEELASQRRVQRIPTDRHELDHLRRIVERNLADASIRQLSNDARAGLCYDAARDLTLQRVAAGLRRVSRELVDQLAPRAVGRRTRLSRALVVAGAVALAAPAGAPAAVSGHVRGVPR